MNISDKVRQYAKEHNFMQIEFAGTTKEGTKVYREIHKKESDGTFAPTGFPYIILEDKYGNLSRQCGLDSLHTLGNIID